MIGYLGRQCLPNPSTRQQPNPSRRSYPRHCSIRGRSSSTGAVLWALTTIAAFVVPALETWRPISLAGLGVGVLGTSIFLWQRTAARRGARGAQTGLGPRVR